MIPVGARLREVRKARGIPTKNAPWSRVYITRVELSYITPSPDRLCAMCEFLGVNPRDILASETEWMTLRMADDPFIKEAANDLLNLTLTQRAQVLDVLQSLSQRG